MISRFIILILFAFTNLYAQTYSAKATTDSLEYFVGDFINYTVSVELPENKDASFTLIPDSLHGLHLLKVKGKVNLKKGNKKEVIFNYILAGYDSLDVKIPEMPVIISDNETSRKDTIFTNEVTLFVKLVNVDEKKDIKDVKDILTIPYDYKKLLLIILSIIVGIILIYFIYRKFFDRKKFNKEEEKKIKVLLPPHKIAYKKLTELENEKLWQQGKIKEYHSKITEIIREYFENRFGFNSLEMTSAETLDELKKHNISDEAWQMARKFLTDADMVKFAKFNPLPEVNNEMMKYAYKIIDLTKEDEILEANNV